jgi:hypothetical protein
VPCLICFSPLQNEDQTLKYLGFFQVAAQTVTTRLSALYDYAKENSGPLKQGVDAMEGTVKLMVGPVYRKVEGKPFEILLLADRKVCRPALFKTRIYLHLFLPFFAPAFYTKKMRIQGIFVILFYFA